MASLTIPNDVFDRLAKRAAALHVTVEQLIAPLLEFAAAVDGNGQPTLSASAPAFDEWKRTFDGWMADVQRRAGRYPRGFMMDDSRENMYAGCGG